jgi:hypothetical protein
MTTLKTPRQPIDNLLLLKVTRPAPPTARDYEWPASAELELWALRIRLEAVCRKGEARQGWVPCRVVRKMIGAA